MFRTVPLPIIRSFSLHTQQRYTSHSFADSLRAGSGRNCCSVLIQCCLFWYFLFIDYVFSCAQKIPVQTTPTETSVPTASKRLNTSHQAFISIQYNFPLMLKTSIFTEHTTNVVIQQESRRLLMMDLLMSETC